MTLTNPGFVFRGNDLNPNWYNLNDVNLIYYFAWTTEYNWIKSIDASNNSVFFHSPSSLVPGSWNYNKRYYVENVLEALDQPPCGERPLLYTTPRSMKTAIASLATSMP